MPSKTMNQKNLVRIFKDVKRLNNDDIRFCFLLGAGASVSSDIPTGWALAERWYNDIKEDFEEKDRLKWEKKIGFDEDRLGEFYPRIYEKRFESSPEMGYAEFKKLMEDKEPSIGYVILAQILANEKHNFVITTNFDYLVEDAVRTYTDTKPFSAGHETLAGFISSQTERPTIIKVHRDLFLDPFNDADKTKILKEEWKNALKPILRNFNLLVLGYGGNDGSLMDYLKEIKPEERKSIYWCKRKQDTINKKVKSLLTNKDYVVTINDFDDVMYALYTKLDYDILDDLDKPDEHKFIINAKEKIKQLNEKKEEIIINGNKDSQVTEVTEAVKELFSGTSTDYLIKINSENDTDLKEKLFKEGIKKYPNSDSLLNNYGLFLEDVKKDPDLAEKYYKKSLKLNSAHASTLANYASLLQYVRRDLGLAEKYYKKSLKLNPKDANVLANFAVLLTNQKYYYAAEEYYKKALKINPENYASLVNYAVFLTEQKLYNLAEDYYKKALKLNPLNAFTLGNYAHHLILSKQDFEEAENYIKEAFNLDPSEDRIRLRLWFYRYAHYKKYYKEATKQIEKILNAGGRSPFWNFQPHIEIAEANGHKDVERLKEFARRITEA